MGANQIKGRVLYVGQAYYNAWYLSRELRKIGWIADQLNVDQNPENQKYYHGQDFIFKYETEKDKIDNFKFFVHATIVYDIFHFSNAHKLDFITDFDYVPSWYQGKKYFLIRKLAFLIRIIALFILDKYCKWDANRLYALVHKVGVKRVYFMLKALPHALPKRWDILLLKKLGKKIVYSNNGCLDGVSQTSFSKWGPASVCDICRWKNVPSVCSDKRNLEWGKIRNQLADYQCLLGGNRVDHNLDPRIHEEPFFYCLDKYFWNPDLLIPTNYILPYPKKTVKIFHAVGNYELRTQENQKNIKCTHIYLPLVKRLKEQGLNVELIFFHDVPNKILRYYQLQADIVVDMLTYGWFGANAREAMMLGKPVICFLRPEWLESMKKEIPDYVKELPIINATPKTIHRVLKKLINNPKKRTEIGKKSRDFAVKWHSSDRAAKRFNRIYSQLLA